MGKKETRGTAEVLRDEMVMHERVIELLARGAKTIPEIAESLGHPSHEVMRWVMAMRRYGMLIEIPKSRADDYYQYTLSDREESC